MKTETQINKTAESIIDLVHKYKLEGSLVYIKEFYEKRNEDGRFSAEAFNDLFDIERDFKIKLAEVSNLYYWSLLIVDKLIDERQEVFNKEALLLSFVLREQGLRMMYNIFPPDHEYWQLFDTYYKEYLNAVVLESNSHFDRITPYSFDDAIHIYSGNASLAKATIAAFAYKSNQPDIIIPLAQSIDFFNIAKNLFDDALDWKKDFINKQYSYFITKVIYDNQLDNDLNKLDANVLGKYVYYTGAVEEILDKSIEYYKKSVNVVEGLKCLTWKNYIKKQIDECLSKKEYTSFVVNRQLKIAGVVIDDEVESKIPKITLTLPVARNLCEEIANNALDYIYKQWKLGFVEAANFQYFPSLESFPIQQPFQIGDVFQRAVIAEVLTEANVWMKNQLAPMLDYEIDYLIEKRVSDKEGWSFYPSLPEQPADTDTTAQVLQVLLKMKKQKVAKKLGQGPIELLLKYRTSEDGVFGTWIIPSDNECSDKHFRQIKFFKEYCQLDIINNKDTEVIANMLYALHLSNPVRFKLQINKALKYIENVQEEEGCWKSTWYYGPLYCTYMSLRILSICKPESICLRKAFDYIIKTQNSDGGWGKEAKGNSDALNTAYALICLSYLRPLISCDFNKYFDRASKYLFDSKNEEGFWPYCDYINMQKRKGSNFRSKTITATYILKAMLMSGSLT